MAINLKEAFRLSVNGLRYMGDFSVTEYFEDRPPRLRII